MDIFLSQTLRSRAFARRLEGWQQAVCQMVRDARRQRYGAADVLLTMRELGYAPSKRTEPHPLMSHVNRIGMTRVSPGIAEKH